MTEPNLTTFRKRLAERSKLAEPEQESAPEWKDNFLDPDAISDAARRVNDACDTITILEVYRKLSKNIFERGHPGNRTEGIKVSCPIPGHEDKRPSCAVNTAKQTWVCYRCEQGGDKYHIAGYAYGLDPRVDFWEIKLRLVKDLREVDYRAPLVDQILAERDAIRQTTADSIKWGT